MDRIVPSEKRRSNILPLNGEQPALMNVNQVERSIKPITCFQAGNNFKRAWGGLARSIVDYAVSVVHVQRELRTFYSSTIFKIKTHHLKQAKNAILSKGISKVINIAGCNEKWARARLKSTFRD
ncbi:hypothetical protein BGZ46_000774 [Entomortierella lignicola]|nr:hypothetical protein BGZ46_000774 [Entomortierella lignicola]